MAEELFSIESALPLRICVISTRRISRFIFRIEALSGISRPVDRLNCASRSRVYGSCRSISSGLARSTVVDYQGGYHRAQDGREEHPADYVILPVEVLCFEHEDIYHCQYNKYESYREGVVLDEPKIVEWWLLLIGVTYLPEERLII